MKKLLWMYILLVTTLLLGCTSGGSSQISTPSQVQGWTWVSGESIPDQLGIYGTKGVASANNIPGSRYAGISWYDETGSLWLFGGFGFSSSTEESADRLNDLWKYNIATNSWTWISGENIINQSGSYGVKGVTASSNMPGSRSNDISWTDGSGNFWLFSGFGSDSDIHNDLWKYVIESE